MHVNNSISWHCVWLESRLDMIDNIVMTSSLWYRFPIVKNYQYMEWRVITVLDYWCLKLGWLTQQIRIMNNSLLAMSIGSGKEARIKMHHVPQIIIVRHKYIQFINLSYIFFIFSSDNKHIYYSPAKNERGFYRVSMHQFQCKWRSGCSWFIFSLFRKS